jgi:multidrug efflux pump
MLITDTAVKRPVFATVISLLLLAFGSLAFERLPLREYPDVDAPIASISTRYSGASAAVIESRITKVLEDRIASVEGIKNISSSSKDGVSNITVEFKQNINIDSATNDIRDRVAGILGGLPDEATAPQIRKQDANARPILWLSLVSERHDLMELTDFSQRYLKNRLSVLDGVADIIIGGGLDYAMRIWLDHQALAARNLTVSDVEDAINRENIELPAGSINSADLDFTVRIQRNFKSADDFRRLVIAQGDNQSVIRLEEVARIEVAPDESRNFYTNNGLPTVGLGIVKQSTANTLAVARQARAEMELIGSTLPEGMDIRLSFDSSIFIESAIDEVYLTLAIAAVLVVLVIYLFLGDLRATIVPAVAVPISLIATFIALYALGYSVNLLTLLAMVLAIGLVVDDAIVVLENIHRRITHKGEPPLLAAFRGSRQVGFAVVATTLVLVAVFVPITMMDGKVGRLFGEFAIAMAAAVIFSSLVALTLSPVLCSVLLKQDQSGGRLDQWLNQLASIYRRSLNKSLRHPVLVALIFLCCLLVAFLSYQALPQEFSPREDRGNLMVQFQAPEGASYAYTVKAIRQAETILMDYVEKKEFFRLIMRSPANFDGSETFNSGMAIIILEPWGERRSVTEIASELQGRLNAIPQLRSFVISPQGLSGGQGNQPVQFVLGGSSYEELAQWRDLMLDEARRIPGLVRLNHDYRETKPQLRIQIDHNRAGELGVSVRDISRTLETFFGGRSNTTFIFKGEERNVILEGERRSQIDVSKLRELFVRSGRSGELVSLANLVSVEEFADAASLNRYNRTRAITLTAGLAPDYTLGEALQELEALVYQQLPPDSQIGYKQESLEFKQSSSSGMGIFIAALLIVYLVLAAQFESFVHPVIILVTVPLAVMGALLGLLLTDQSVNIYSQIAVVMLIGLAAKNGILIVEFANQLRDKGRDFETALLEACELRMRPILMTAVTTIMGALPLVLASGAGSESRFVIGVVVISGIVLATLLTLFVVPAAYSALARGTRSPGAVSGELEGLIREAE